jgi:hypothetical protein
MASIVEVLVEGSRSVILNVLSCRCSSVSKVSLYAVFVVEVLCACTVADSGLFAGA